MRRFITLLLLLCLPMYGLAMQGSLSPAYGGQSLAHSVAHDEHILHHHHADDGSVHYDASDESLAHAQDHSCAQPVDLHLPALRFPPEEQLYALVSFTAAPVPEPFLDGPRKPPRHAPGHAAGGMTHA